MPGFRHFVLPALGAFAVVAAPCLISATPAAAKSAASKIRAYDPDHDGTLDLNEVKAGAAASFTALDRDRDGSLDQKELHGRLNKKEFAAANPDHDKTLEKNEYIAAATQAFETADTDHDGTVDAKELKSKDGRLLRQLLK